MPRPMRIMNTPSWTTTTTADRVYLTLRTATETVEIRLPREAAADLGTDLSRAAE